VARATTSGDATVRFAATDLYAQTVTPRLAATDLYARTVRVGTRNTRVCERPTLGETLKEGLAG
jgi:hypothetical protein